MINEQDKKEIEQIIDEKVKNDFSKRIGDTPTDNLQLVNRKYVNLNGTLVNRPISSVATIGQQYFATDLGYPIYFNGTHWVNSVSSVIGM
jgi:hypothetical protein